MAGSSHSGCWLYHCLIAESGKRALETPAALCQRHSFVAMLKVLSHSKCSKQNGIIYKNAVWADIWWDIIQTPRQKNILSTGKVFTIQTVLKKNFYVKLYPQYNLCYLYVYTYPQRQYWKEIYTDVNSDYLWLIRGFVFFLLVKMYFAWASFTFF